MEPIEGYRKLEIYQLAHSIGVNIHQFSLKLPKHVYICVYALASCDETVEWLQYVKDCYAEHSTKADEFLDSTNELGEKINRFLQSVGSFHSSPK